MKRKAEVVICGAGIAGISAAYHLSVKHGIRDVLLIDERPPLSLTSDKSTECYRNWWPGPGNGMVALMNRSIDLMEELAEESGNIFHLNRRGYLYVSANAQKIPDILEAAAEPPELGAGPLRVYRGRPNDPIYTPSSPESYTKIPDGADLLLDPGVIRKHFPYLSEQVAAALHVRRAGWFSAQQMGMYLLEQARVHGVELVNARISGVSVKGNRVQSVCLDGDIVIETSTFVNAAGPMLKHVGHFLGVDLPVFSELHLKVAFKDSLEKVPRQAPLLIWTDPQFLAWSLDEREFLGEDPETRWLLEEFPAGAHARPEGGPESQMILMLWEYQVREMDPVWPIPLDEQYPEVALRGLTAMLPGLRSYIGHLPRPVLDGGYYTKTRENRPLICPLPVKGAYVIGALSGFGLMASCAAGELLAAHLTGTPLPAYAPAFSLERYQDAKYLRLLENWGDSGQL